MLEQRAADPVPDRRDGTFRHARQRRHAEVECLEALVAQMLDDAHEQKIHRAFWRIRREAHQVDGAFLQRIRDQQVGEGDDPALKPQHCHRLRQHVIAIEGTERKTLFAGIVMAEPGIGNRL